MTLQEFKAWFDGFTENIGEKVPTQKQWKRIKERVSEIDGTAISYPVYIDRWIHPYPRYWSSGGGTWMSGNNVADIGSETVFETFCQNLVGNNTVSLSAMMLAGQAEAASMT